jgi:hypothetical protein
MAPLSKPQDYLAISLALPRPQPAGSREALFALLPFLALDRAGRAASADAAPGRRSPASMPWSEPRWWAPAGRDAPVQVDAVTPGSPASVREPAGATPVQVTPGTSATGRKEGREAEGAVLPALMPAVYWRERGPTPAWQPLLGLPVRPPARTAAAEKSRGAAAVRPARGAPALTEPAAQHAGPGIVPAVPAAGAAVAGSLEARVTSVPEARVAGQVPAPARTAGPRRTAPWRPLSPLAIEAVPPCPAAKRCTSRSQPHRTWHGRTQVHQRPACLPRTPRQPARADRYRSGPDFRPGFRPRRR